MSGNSGTNKGTGQWVRVRGQGHGGNNKGGFQGKGVGEYVYIGGGDWGQSVRWRNMGGVKGQGQEGEVWHYWRFIGVRA